MPSFHRLDDRVAVAPQIDPADMPAIAAAGFARIVNNRPDDEESGQPTGETFRAAAEAAGLDYVAIPIAGGFGIDDVRAMAAALDASGPVFAFCRSGTRSTHLWALARAMAGEDIDAVIEQAADAGYDIRAMRPMLRQVAGS